mgnify:CR=1 FL=1
MNLALNEDQRLIRESAESFLADVSTSSAVRAAMDSAQGFDEAVWQRIASELGWCGIAVPEAHGGLGLGIVELVQVQELAGQKLLCAPFFSSVCLATTLLQQVGTAEVQADREPLAVNFAKAHHVVLLLKGHRTIVTDGDPFAASTTCRM